MSGTHLYEVLEVSCLMSQRICRQSISKRHQSMWKVMLREPGDNLLLLHVRPACNVYNQVPQFLPVPETVKVGCQCDNRHICHSTVLPHRRIQNYMIKLDSRASSSMLAKLVCNIPLLPENMNYASHIINR